MVATLVIVKRDGRHKEIPLRPGVSVIGRRPDCDIRVPLAVVSRKHCRIVHQDDGTVVQDLGSVNGTYVNSERVTEAPVRAGDVLAVGPFAFIIRIDGQPQKITAPEPPASVSDSGLDGNADQPTSTPGQPGPARAEGNGLDPLAQLEPSAEDDGLRTP